MYNLEGKIGGDAELSPRGEMYAKKLPELVLESVGVCIFLQFEIPMTNGYVGQSTFNRLDLDSPSYNCYSPSFTEGIQPTPMESFG
jgi:hypothetical protein